MGISPSVSLNGRGRTACVNGGPTERFKFTYVRHRALIVLHSSREAAMGTASVTIRVDESTKRAVSAIAEDFGLDISSITRAFYKQIEREQRIPLSLEYPRPNNASLESVREAERIIAEKRPGYATAEEMFDAMGV